MADNATIGGVKFLTDEVSRNSETGHAQIIKLGFGANDAYDGDVDDLLPLPVNAALRTDVIQNGNSQVTPVFLAVNVAATDTTLVAAVSGKKIRVFALCLSSAENDGGTIRFETNAAGGTALTGAIPVLKSSPLVLPFMPLGWFETGSGELLNMESSGTAGIDGHIIYGLI